MSLPVRMWFKFLCLLAGMLLLTGNTKMSAADEQEKSKSTNVKVVKFGKLWDGKGKLWTNASIVIEGDRIKEVTADVKRIPAEAEVIDLGKYYGLPGLIDVHTHLTYLPPDTANPSSPALLPGEVVFLSQQNARKTLEAGVTTVRDLGAIDQNDVALRNLINRGSVVGPRMFVSGCGLYVTADPWRPTGVEPDCGRADGKVEVERSIRQHVASGVDVIKMYGSTGTGDDVTGYQTFTTEELQTAVEVAHKYGKKVAVHSYGPDGARDAVQAGADSIEHATDMDDATMKQMVARGTFYVPTIDHNRYYVDAAKELNFNAQAVTRLKDYIARNLVTARKAHQAGVRFAMGSDAVYTMFGQNTRELGWFVKAGMTPEEALKTATINAAELLGKSSELGLVAPGYFADLVAIDGDPTNDIPAAIDKVK